jgi:fatty-acid desaturase
MNYNKKLLSLVLIHFCLCLYSVILHFDWLLLLTAYILALLFNMLGHETASHRLWAHKYFSTT